MFSRRTMFLTVTGTVLAAPFVARAQGGSVTPRDLADTLAADGRFNRFMDLFTRARVLDVLRGTQVLTVFAPPNDAFDRSVPSGLLADLVGDGNRGPDPRLGDLLKFHIVPGSFGSTAFTRGSQRELPTLNGAPLRVDATRGIMEITPARPPGMPSGGFGAAGLQVQSGSAKIVQADMLASNGVIHVIDRVLFPG